MPFVTVPGAGNCVTLHAKNWICNRPPRRQDKKDGASRFEGAALELVGPYVFRELTISFREYLFEAESARPG